MNVAMVFLASTMIMTAGVENRQVAVQETAIIREVQSVQMQDEVMEISNMDDNGDYLSMLKWKVLLSTGETHELHVVSKDFRKLAGWKIKEVKTSNENVKICEIKDFSVIIKGANLGETDIEIHLENSMCVPAKMKVLTCKICIQNSEDIGTRQENEKNSNEELKEEDKDTGNNAGDNTEGDNNTGDNTGGDNNAGDNTEGDNNTGDNTGGDEQLKKFDTSTWKFDENSLVVQYDGKTHLPKLVGVPDEVEVVWPNGITNAGKYEDEVSFKVPDGYEAVPNKKFKFEIKKAEITTNVVMKDGKIIAEVDGIVADDISSDEIVKYLVNGKEYDTAPAITEPGRYETTAQVAIDEEKRENYTGLDVCDTVFDVKRENAWYKLSMDASKQGDKIVLQVYLSDIKVKTPEDYSLLTLGFDIDYNKSVLEWESEDDYSNGENWDGEYNATRRDQEPVKGENDCVTMFFSDEAVPEKMLVCEITYNILDEDQAENLEFTITNSNICTGEEDNPFTYTADNITVIANKTEEVKEEKIEYIDWDLMKDVQYTGDEDEQEEYEKELKEYIENELLPVELSESEQEEIGVITGTESSIETEQILNSVENEKEEKEQQEVKDLQIKDEIVYETQEANKVDVPNIEEKKKQEEIIEEDEEQEEIEEEEQEDKELTNLELADKIIEEIIESI